MRVVSAPREADAVLQMGIHTGRGATPAQNSTQRNTAAVQGSAYFKSENVAWTFAYAAPELLLNASCSAKVDIYSFGVILW